MLENSPETIRESIYHVVDEPPETNQSETSPILASLYVQLMVVIDIINKIMNKDVQSIAPGVVDVIAAGGLGLLRAIKKQLGLP